MKKKVVAGLLCAALCVTTAAPAGAASFSDGSNGSAVAETGLGTETPAVEILTEVPVMDDDFGDGSMDASVDEPMEPSGGASTEGPGAEAPDADITPGPDSITPAPELPGDVTPAPAEPGDVTPTPDPDVDVFVPVSPTPSVSPTPVPVQTEEPDIFTSGDDLLYALSVKVSTEVNKTDWELADPVNNTYKLRKADGTYYTSEDGIVYIETVEDRLAPETDISAHTGYAGYYMFDANGLMVTGRQTILPGTPGYDRVESDEFFFTDPAHAAALEEGNAIDPASCSPVTSDLGMLKLKYWLWTEGTFRYYDSSGRFLSMAELKEIREAAGNYVGYYTINEENYCLDEDGAPRVGYIDIKDGEKPGTYYFEEVPNLEGVAGQMARNRWKCRVTSKGEQWQYFQKDGRARTGIIATKLDSEIKGDDVYLLGAVGYIQKNKMLKAANGYYYGSDSTGRIVKNKIAKYGSARYYFGSDGRRVKWANCWHRCPGAENRFYYFGKTAGRIVEKKGWQFVSSVSGKKYGWFYFPDSGDHYINRWMGDVYFTDNGRLGSGLTEIGGKTYFFRTSNPTTHNGQVYKNTMISYKGKWYYAGPKGILGQNRWVKSNGNYYYCQDDFTIKTNAYIKKGNVNGYVDSTGKFCTGWVVVNNSKNLVRYLNPDGGGFLKNTSRVIDGLRYYFDKDGYRKNDLTSTIKGPYYVEVDRVNGVMTVFDSGRTTPVKSIRVSVGLPGTATPTGRYVLYRSARWQALMGPSWGQYGTP